MPVSFFVFNCPVRPYFRGSHVLPLIAVTLIWTASPFNRFPTTAVTLTAWVRIQSTPSNAFRTLMSFSHPSVPTPLAFAVRVNTYNGQVYGVVAGVYIVAPPVSSLVDKEWHLLVVSYSSTTSVMTFFVDTVAVSSVTTGLYGTIPAGGGCLVIGQQLAVVYTGATLNLGAGVFVAGAEWVDSLSEVRHCSCESWDHWNVVTRGPTAVVR